MNPYYNKTFFGFFVELMHRLFTGNIEFSNLASDELQILTLALISLSSACVGTFLYLRKMTMLANALSHTILTGVVFAYLFGAKDSDFTHLLPNQTYLFVSALFMALLTTFLTEFFISKVGLPEDASCALVFTFLFALGVLTVTIFSKNAHIGAELLMGNADALHQDDLSMQLKITILTLAFVAIFFRGFFVTTFDPLFSSVLGISPSYFGYFLMSLVAIVSIGAFRAVGVLLVLAFFVGPPLIARMWTKKLLPLMLFGASISIISSIVAVAFSRHLLSQYNVPVSTSALVVCIIALLYFISISIKLVKGRLLLTKA